MRRPVALFLVVILCIALLFGCSSKPGSTDVGDSTDSSSSDTSGSEKDDSSDTASEAEKTPDELLHEKYPEPVKIRIVLGYRESENPDTPDSVKQTTAKAVKK